MQPQLSCRIGGKRLVSLMPTLLQQIWRSPGGSRAWTLQEALLSPRTAIGQRPPAQHRRPEKGAWLASRVGDGCLRTPIDITSQRLERYGSKLTLYSYRRMTDQADGLNAFSGILSFLRRMYTGGFHNGLPLEDFQWGLLWCAQGRPVRRPGFPSWSWSWAGWQGGLWPGYPVDFTKPHESPVRLHIHKLNTVSGFVELFK